MLMILKLLNNGPGRLEVLYDEDDVNVNQHLNKRLQNRQAR